MQKQFRTTGVLALALAALAACHDAPTRLLAPEGASFVQLPVRPVVTSLLDDGDGSCTEAKCTLRDAIAFADAGAIIIFDVTGTITLTRGQLGINKNLTISGPGASSLSVSGNNASRVLSVAPGATLHLSGLTITGGRAPTDGGGIDNQGGLVIENSTIAANSARDWGGGIFSSGTLTLRNSTVSGNSGPGGGGGIFIHQGTAEIRTSTISGNEGEPGGGIYNLQGILDLQNSTITGNRALGGGGGIFNWHTLTLQTSILAGNEGGDCFTGGSGSLTDQGYNLDGDGSCISAATSISADPRLGPLASNGGPTRTHALLAGSPALDAVPFGVNGCEIGSDQRGLPRPRAGACDIGAFEHQPTVAPTLQLTLDAEGTVVRGSGGATLSGTLTCAAPTSVQLDVSLMQQQTRGKNMTTVTGSGSRVVACYGPTPWSVTVTPTSGKFAAGAAEATASVAGATPPVRAERTVQLR